MNTMKFDDGCVDFSDYILTVSWLVSLYVASLACKSQKENFY